MSTDVHELACTTSLSANLRNMLVQVRLYSEVNWATDKVVLKVINLILNDVTSQEMTNSSFQDRLPGR